MTAYVFINIKFLYNIFTTKSLTNCFNKIFLQETDPIIENLLNSFWLFEPDEPSLFDKSTVGQVLHNKIFQTGLCVIQLNWSCLLYMANFNSICRSNILYHTQEG